MIECVFSASDIVSLVLILVEIKCFDRFSKLTNSLNTCDGILKILTAAFGWSGIGNEVDSLIRNLVAKYVLFPKFVFSVVAFLIEWVILYSENESLENDYPGGRWVAVGISISLYTVFLMTMFFVACRTDTFKHAILYFSFLLFYRFFDLEMNSVLLWLSVKYDEVNTNSIVTHAITVYSIFEVVVGFLQLCKAVLLFVNCFINIRNEVSPV